MAIAALVLGLVGLIPCAFGIPALLGVIFGFVGRNQIAKSNGTKKGSGMALAGIILGIIGIVFTVAFIAWIRKNCTTLNGVTTCNRGN
jgi:uncharacterized membrane protein